MVIEAICTSAGLMGWFDDTGKGLRGRFPNIPNQAKKGQELDDIVTHVDLPPAETLLGAALIVVVVVVPTFAESDDRNEEIIPTLIAGDKSLSSPQDGRSN